MKFQYIESILTDGSKVYDVEERQGTMWPRPSKNSAEIATMLLNDLVEGLELCGSDQKTYELSRAIKKALDDVLGPE